MKRILPIVLIASAVVLSNCSKSTEPTRIINCDGLVTDTLGTGDNGRIYMPNAFSPNNDGLNEICRPVTQNIVSLVFTLYDANNVVIFTTTVPGYGWQPSIQGSNTSKKYYYKIQATTVSNKKIGLCGEVYSLTCFPVNLPKSFFYFEDMLTPNGFTGLTNESLPTCF
jgi:hypothetical protein